MSTQAYDVIAAEVHRKALENVAREMAISLVRTSGSPVVVESKDYSTCVMDTIPEHLSIGLTTIPHIGSSLVGTRRVTEVASSEEIEPGSGWVVNDPHTAGALHQADIGIIMPTFYGDLHVGWSFVNTHILDIGGSGISGFAAGARDMYEEGLRFPVARIIRDGVIEPAWREFIAANVRTPAPVLNDLRSMIAANNTASRKVAEIVGRYGVETHREFCELNKAHTEQLLRARISALPDGVYHAVDWTELRRGRADERIIELELTLEIDGSDAYFSFSSPPQVDAFVNGTPGVILGWLAGEVARVLGFGDLPLNGGLWRPLHVDHGEPGTVMNSLPPAAVGNGHGAIGCRVSQLTRDVLTQAASLSDDPALRARVAGRGVDSFPAASWFGTNQHGKQSVMFYVDNAMATGGAAQTTNDGADTFGIGQALGSGIADVETHEALDPLLFLWRRLVPDTGGPGQHRGGLGMEQAYTLRYADVAAGPLWDHGLQVPAVGAGGGCPAPPGTVALLRETNIGELFERGALPAPHTLSGTLDDVEGLVASAALRRGDAFIARSGGGSGLGDPLLRDAELVARDVADGWVSPEQASSAYGVELTGSGRVDAAATAARREGIRRRRIDGEPARGMSRPESFGVSLLVDDGAWACAYCGERLGELTSNWRMGDAVAEITTPATQRLAEWRMQLSSREHPPGIVLREYGCRACGGSLAVDVSTDARAPHPAPALGVAGSRAAAPASAVSGAGAS